MKRSVQWLRHLTRLLVLVALVTVPFLAHYRVALYRQQLDAYQTAADPALPARALLATDALVRAPSPSDETSKSNASTAETIRRLAWFRGNVWSAQIGWLSLIDPLAGLESILAAGTVAMTVLMGLLLPVLATLLLGRVFCSWVCPAGFLFELGDKVRSRCSRLATLANIRFWRGHKYTLLVTGLLFGVVLGTPVLGYFYPPALLGREVHHWMDSVFGAANASALAGGAWIITGATLFIVALVALEVFVSRRMWCRYFCPGGALYGLLGAGRVLRVRNDRARCTDCAVCTQACPMGLNPMRHQPGVECDQCLVCWSVCPEGSLALRPSWTDTARHAPNAPPSRLGAGGNSK